VTPNSITELPPIKKPAIPRRQTQKRQPNAWFNCLFAIKSEGKIGVKNENVVLLVYSKKYGVKS